MKNELRRMLEDLETLEAVAIVANIAYEEDPKNPEKEAASDEAYRAEWEASEAAAALMVRMTGGAVDVKTARIMIKTKRAELLRLTA